MKQNIALIIPPHLGHELGIHVGDVDLVEVLAQDGNGFVELLHVDDDAG